MFDFYFFIVLFFIFIVSHLTNHTQYPTPHPTPHPTLNPTQHPTHHTHPTQYPAHPTQSAAMASAAPTGYVMCCVFFVCVFLFHSQMFVFLFCILLVTGTMSAIAKITEMKQEEEEKKALIEDMECLSHVAQLIMGAIVYYVFEILILGTSIPYKLALELINTAKPDDEDAMTMGVATTLKFDFMAFKIESGMNDTQVWQFIQKGMDTGIVAFEKEKKILEKVFTMKEGSVERERMKKLYLTKVAKKQQAKEKRENKRIEKETRMAETFEDGVQMLRIGKMVMFDFQRPWLMKMIENYQTVVGYSNKNFQADLTTPNQTETRELSQKFDFS